MKFDQLGLRNDELKAFFTENELARPTEVQEKVIPNFMQGRNVVCVAQTGTGKTLAYALPLASKIKNIEEEEGILKAKSKPLALILSPTRELATQIQDVLKTISHHLKVRVRMMAGSTTSLEMRKLSTASYEVLVATPNRVKSALMKKELSLEDVRYVIFDEADQLFDMGFKKDIDHLLNNLSEEIQLGFFTATMGQEVEAYVNEKFADKNLLKVSFESSQKMQARVETFNIFVKPEEKHSMVKLFLEKTAKGRGIIFCNQKNQAEELAKFLTEKAPKTKFRLLHGDLDKLERQKSHKAFKDKKIQFLVATDIAARGIDVDDLWWILNLGLPKKPEYYLHRAGRIARGGKRGVVYNLVTERDSKWIEIINSAIKSQSSLEMDFITKSLSENRKQKQVKKQKVKRVKETKRTKAFGIKKR